MEVFVGLARDGAPASPESTPDLTVTVVRRGDCSHGVLTVGAIRRLADELRIAIHVEEVLVRTDEDAHAHRCLGSPTVLVAGQDVEPAARGRKTFGVT
jgi:hypothetical protein